MNTDAASDTLQVGDYRAHRASGELAGPTGVIRLEPKVMDLLFLLASQPGQVMSRERIMDALWPELVVGDDSLARTVSKLRQALGDDAKAPRYIETLSKRGYRLLARVGAATPAGNPHPGAFQPSSLRPRPLRARLGLVVIVVLVLGLLGLGWVVVRRSTPPGRDATATLLTRADDYYFQFTRGDNEAAIELYQRVLGQHPDDPGALAGLANALAQRAIRWPQLPGEGPVEFHRLGDALAHGHLGRDPARQQLQRAQHLAERAVALAPDSAAAHKALGFVAGAQRRFAAALASYRRAVKLDPDAWGALINIGDLLEITGKDAEALAYFEQAHAAMGRVYDRNPVQVRPWHAALGTLIAGRHRDRGDRSAAEGWYRRVLAQSPLHPAATRGLAELLRAGGDATGADRLCAELAQRVGAGDACDTPAAPGDTDVVE
ncbi:MAG: winged helix-turn-helix domain-containing protein [Lysobacter sp.]